MQENENFELEEEMEPQIIMLEDDEGNEEEFEFIDVVEYEDEEYVVLMPTADENDSEVVILKIENADEDNESYVSVDDDELLDNVFEAFKQRYPDEFDGE